MIWSCLMIDWRLRVRLMLLWRIRSKRTLLCCWIILRDAWTKNFDNIDIVVFFNYKKFRFVFNLIVVESFLNSLHSFLCNYFAMFQRKFIFKYLIYSEWFLFFIRIFKIWRSEVWINNFFWYGWGHIWWIITTLNLIEFPHALLEFRGYWSWLLLDLSDRGLHIGRRHHGWLTW